MDTTMTVSIERVNFHGAEILAAKVGSDIWVPVKRISDVLGIDHDSQRKKLKEQAWAVTVMITATAPDGKKYDTFCIHVDKLPMWLATIDANRVVEEKRETLVRFQCEAAPLQLGW